MVALKLIKVSQSKSLLGSFSQLSMLLQIFDMDNE